MACTAVSTEPWPVITAISTRGRIFLTFSRHSWHDQVSKNDVCRLLLQKRQGCFSGAGLHANEAQALCHSHAESANAFFVVHYQETNLEMRLHSGFPTVSSTTAMNCCTRNGFSTQGAPVFCRVAAVSSLAISPVMKTSREASSGRLCEIQA